MTSFGSGAVVAVALGGTSTSRVTGIEAGEGLAFFFGFLGGMLPELFLRIMRKYITKPECMQI
jgi:hypothetical protein